MIRAVWSGAEIDVYGPFQGSNFDLPKLSDKEMESAAKLLEMKDGAQLYKRYKM